VESIDEGSQFVTFEDAELFFETKEGCGAGWAALRFGLGGFGGRVDMKKGAPWVPFCQYTQFVRLCQDLF